MSCKNILFQNHITFYLTGFKAYSIVGDWPCKTSAQTQRSNERGGQKNLQDFRPAYGGFHKWGNAISGWFLRENTSYHGYHHFPKIYSLSHRCPFPIGWLINRGVSQTHLTTGKWWCRWYTKPALLFLPSGVCPLSVPNFVSYIRFFDCQGLNTYLEPNNWLANVPWRAYWQSQNLYRTIIDLRGKHLFLWVNCVKVLNMHACRNINMYVHIYIYIVLHYTLSWFIVLINWMYFCQHKGIQQYHVTCISPPSRRYIQYENECDSGSIVLPDFDTFHNHKHIL